jgi:hypothetical protein
MNEIKNNIEQHVKLITVDQLHDSLMTFNKNSIELKKLCIGLITGVPAVLYKINGDAIKYEHFVILLIMVVGFLILDSHYHYNQKKIRLAMNHIKKELAQNSEDGSNEEKIIGISTDDKIKWYKSVFNFSNVLYYFLILFCFYYIWSLK